MGEDRGVNQTCPLFWRFDSFMSILRTDTVRRLQPALGRALLWVLGRPGAFCAVLQRPNRKA